MLFLIFSFGINKVLSYLKLLLSIGYTKVLVFKFFLHKSRIKATSEFK